MRWLWLAILGAAAGTGCLERGAWSPLKSTPHDAATATSRSLSPVAAVSEGLYIESVLLERPIGDEALDRDLWATALPSLPPQISALLEENGLRVAVLTGTLPPAFQKLLDSEADVVHPHGLTFANRKEAVIPTADPPDPCEFDVLTDLAATRTKVKLTQPHSGILVKPESRADGRVNVCCEPQIQHGTRVETLRPTADGTSFVKQSEVPVASYAGLGFEVALAPNDFLLIGWPANASRTLGSVLFAVEANGLPRQRVLVIRASHLGAPVPNDLPKIRGIRGRQSIAAEASRQ